MKKLIVVVVFYSLLMLPGISLAKDPPFLSEIIVVFKKEVSLKKARKIMTKFDLPHREGSDNSKGRIYFYKTGPKFILHVDKDKSNAFIQGCSKTPQIFECYLADWELIKD